MTGILGLAGRGLHGLFQCDSRPQSGQRAGQTSLNQVLLLVEVDVELVEAGDLAALGGADGVVAQVDEDAQQVMLLAGLVLLYPFTTSIYLQAINNVRRHGQ